MSNAGGVTGGSDTGGTITVNTGNSTFGQFFDSLQSGGQSLSVTPSALLSIAQSYGILDNSNASQASTSKTHPQALATFQSISKYLVIGAVVILFGAALELYHG